MKEYLARMGMMEKKQGGMMGRGMRREGEVGEEDYKSETKQEKIDILGKSQFFCEKMLIKIVSINIINFHKTILNKYFTI